MKLAGLLLAVALLMAGLVRVQAARERAFPTAEDTEDGLYLTSGEALRHLTVGLNALASDVYWVRALQHYGGTKRRLAASPGVAPPPLLVRSSDYSQLYPLLDITTTLDPRFHIAYRFGAVFLAESAASGPGRPDLAVRLLEKGLRAEPDKWEYMEDIGFVHYWYEHDYPRAAERFRQAADIQGAPWWLKSLAATTLAEGGDRRSSRLMWQAIEASAEIDWLRGDAARRLRQLDALDQIDQLQRIADREAQLTGRLVTDWRTLIAAGFLRAIPVDPTGIAFEITQDGHVRMAPASSLWPLPLEPQRLGMQPALSP